MINPNRDIILIGGAPTTGKSTLAHNLARELDIPWISTDQIRDIMRAIADRKEYPLLFLPEEYSAERFYAESSAEQIVAREIRQGKAVWPFVKRFIEREYTWEHGFVMEGINLLPSEIARDFGSNPHVKAVFLVDENRNTVRQFIFARGLMDDAHKYPDDIKEKETDWSLLFAKTIKADAGASGYPFLDVHRDETDLWAVRDLLKLA